MDIFKSTKISLSFLTLICLAVFLGCNGNNGEEKPIRGNFEEWGLDSETEMQIKQDYLDAFIKPDFPEAAIEDVRIEKCYGTYDVSIRTGTYNSPVWRPDGSIVVVMMADNYKKYDNVSSKVVIGSVGSGWVLLPYSNENRIIVWRDKDNSFYELQEAYNKGWLNDRLLRRILNYHLGMDKEVEKRLFESYYEKYFMPDPIASHLYTAELLSRIYRYYGTYNGCSVIMDGITESGDMVYMLYDYVAGIVFALETRNYGIAIEVWKEEDNSFYPLLTAYEQGLLTREDLVNIAHIRSMHMGHEKISLFENGNIYAYDVGTGEKKLSVENFDINNFRFYVE